MKNNAWFFYVGFVIRIKNVDFETFKLLSNFYKI